MLHLMARGDLARTPLSVETRGPHRGSWRHNNIIYPSYWLRTVWEKVNILTLGKFVRLLGISCKLSITHKLVQLTGLEPLNSPNLSL